jgi:hypothetical protein
VPVPHTFVSLPPPAGFTATRAFGGFENRRAGWTIRVRELGPEAYPGLAAAFSSLEKREHARTHEELANSAGTNARSASGISDGATEPHVEQNDRV